MDLASLIGLYTDAAAATRDYRKAHPLFFKKEDSPYRLAWRESDEALRKAITEPSNAALQEAWEKAVGFWILVDQDLTGPDAEERSRRAKPTPTSSQHQVDPSTMTVEEKVEWLVARTTGTRPGRNQGSLRRLLDFMNGKNPQATQA